MYETKIKHHCMKRVTVLNAFFKAKILNVMLIKLAQFYPSAAMRNVCERVRGAAINICKYL